MFKEMKKRIKNEKGLTLIELLAVIVILAIIAAIAVPAIGNIINNTRDKAVLSDISSAIAAAKIAKADGSCGLEETITAIGDGSSSTTGVVCTGKEFEFKSDKIVDGTGANAGGEGVTITFASDGGVKVEAIITKKFSGTRISDAITAEGSAPHSADGDDLTITETDLNKVLGGN